ncbi:hypothetical protein [Streptomyces sp. C36]|uniref:hypothetical protein n=1 Tax=Streptomyces sp. C36 TaxID=3237122 RepID=UPI0034C600ED
MRESEYRSHGTPLEEYQLTRRDHSGQKVADQIRDAVGRQAAEWRAAEAADPELKQRADARRQEVLELMLSFKNPDHEIMRWRVRLYCGHITETQRHCENDEPTKHGSSSMRCPECGKDPARIVAYEPIGLAAEPPRARSGTVAPTRQRKPSRVELERRVAELEAENRRLRGH